MFSKLAFFISTAAFFATSAIAGPLGGGQCNTGPVQCCNSLQAATDADAAHQLALLGVLIQSVTGQVGLQCNPVSVVDVGSGANCASSPVCCEKNYSKQLVGINCSPINVLV